MTDTHTHDIDISQLTSDKAIWSHLVGKPVNVNIAGRDSWSIVTLAQVTESFLIFQVADDELQLHTKMLRHDCVRSVDVCHQHWATPGRHEVVGGLFKTEWIPGIEGEIFGTIELDHHTPTVIENKKRGGGGGVGVGFAVPIG